MKPIGLLSSPIKVWYKPLPLVREILWPIVDIDIKTGSFSLPQKILSLVDSGASSSILHMELAEARPVAKLDFQRFKGFFEVRFREDIN